MGVEINGTANRFCGLGIDTARRTAGADTAAICDFLEDQQRIVEQVRRDLARGLKKPKSGRRGLTRWQ